MRIATDENVDAVLCGGDLYEHDRFSADTGEFLRSTFQSIHPVPIFVAPGNHDWYGPESLYRQVRWSANVHVFSSDRLEPVDMGGGLVLWGAAHCAPANTDGFVERFRVPNRHGVNIALFHGSEVNSLFTQEQGKMPHAPFHAEEIDRAGLDHAFLGHFHRPRDAERYTYPGNPDPLEFGEDGERGVVIATVGADRLIARERRKVGVSQVQDLTVDVTGCMSQQDVRELISSRLSGLAGSARVTLEGELAPDAELPLRDLDDIAPHLDGFVLRTGLVHVGYDVATIAKQETVAGHFVCDVRASGLPSDVVERILVTGLRALEGRSDLEAF